MVPQLFLSSNPPVDLQLKTLKEWFGLRPSEAISYFGTATTTCPEEIAFLIMLAKLESEAKYFLTGAPVKSLK